ncbi:hypothetical protein VTO73DRAFT_5550 [Trametes versicolor]
MAIPLPSPESLAHRARLAALLSQLRPTQFRAPLTRLPAHRIPTLWTLYRGVLRDAPTDTIRGHMRDFFRERKCVREQGDVTRYLRTAYARWDVFRKVKAGDRHFDAVCARYSRMIQGAALQAKTEARYQNELAWQERLRTRPVLTGAFLKPTILHGPLPRMRPQPLHVTGMIVWRRKARERRLAKQEQLQEQMKYLDAESEFERNLARGSNAASFEGAFDVYGDSWGAPIAHDLQDIKRSFDQGRRRSRMPFPLALLEQIKSARRARIENKTRERERERRGEMTNRLLKQMRGRPPAHRLALMSLRQRRMDAIARGVSEVGYVGQVKRALGFKLRNPDAWKAEMGRPENREMLDRLAKEVEEENARREAEVPTSAG